MNLSDCLHWVFAKLNTLLILTVISLHSISAHAEQKKLFDGPDGSEYELHYVAYASTFLSPEVAKEYGIVRSKALGVVNISLLKKAAGEKFGTPEMALVRGTVTNEIRQQQSLNFKQVVEGKAVYYIAQTQFREGKYLRLDIEVYPAGARDPLIHRFSQAFYNE